ncbi:MAG: uroporphyrinogen-III synthase [Salegentibacter sp.]
MPTVLSTKKLSTNQKELLLNAGLSLVEYDAIKIEFQPLPALTSSVENAIITSKNAAKVVIKEKLQIKNCFCVGDKTAALLENNGFSVIETAEQASALAEIITAQYCDKSFTFFCGNKRRDELPQVLKEKKVKLEEIEVYRTGLNFREFHQEFDGILFFSPSGVRSFAKLNNFKNTIAFCIGSTTASEVKKYTNRIEIANQPGIENVIARAAKILK